MYIKGANILEATADYLETILFSTVSLVAILIEFWGLYIIIVAMTKEVYRVTFKYKLDFKMINRDDNLNAGLESALEVLLAAEILKTIAIDSYQNLIIIGILIFLRISMAVLLIWEAGHNEKADFRMKHNKNN